MCFQSNMILVAKKKKLEPEKKDYICLLYGNYKHTSYLQFSASNTQDRLNAENDFSNWYQYRVTQLTTDATNNQHNNLLNEVKK